MSWYEVLIEKRDKGTVEDEDEEGGEEDEQQMEKQPLMMTNGERWVLDGNVCF